jgi:HlyD family secretion protein
MKKWMRVGILVIVVVILIAVIIGIFGKNKAVDSQFDTYEVQKGNLLAIVGATGSVHANQSASITWQTSGRIDKVFVAVDDKVKKGDQLAVLDKTSLSQSIILATADLVEAKKALQNLEESSVAKATASLNLAQAQLDLETALDDRGRKEYRRASDNTLDGIRADLVLAKDAVDKAEDYYRVFEERYSEEDPLRAAALSQLVNARKQYQKAQYNMNYALGYPDADEVTKADAQVALAEATLADAQREYDRLKDGPDPDDLAAAQARIDAITATIDMAGLTAPFAGTVSEVNAKPGDLVSAGSVAFRVDDLSHLLVDVEVPEVDINKVALGHTATMVFDSIQGKEYQGEVVEIGRVGINTATGVSFKVTVELIPADEEVLPGMTAAVNIIVKQLEDVITIPNRAIRIRDGKRVVYRLVNGNPELVEIELGSSSETISEIISGNIEIGDLIILNPPAELQMGPGGRPF